MKVSLPIRLLLAIVAAVLSFHFLPPFFTQLFYTLGLAVKDAMVMIVPFLIVLSIFHAFLQNQKRGTSWGTVIGGLFVAVFLSGILGSLYSYTLGMPLLSLIHLALPASSTSTGIEALWRINVQLLPFGNEYLLLGSLVLAPLLSRIAPAGFAACTHQGNRILLFLLQRIFLPVFPLLVFGFTLDLLYQGVLSVLVGKLGWVLGTIVLVEASYLLLLYWVSFRFSLSKALVGLKNVVPAGILGFCAGSSAAALPLSLEAAAKNTQNSGHAELSISTTVNIHLMGDSLNMIILALAVMKMFNFPMPELVPFLIMASSLTLSRFAAAAIPGGSTFIMMPVLEKYLHFTPEMIAIVVALDILLDSLTTVVNVVGNGGFAVLYDRIAGKWGRCGVSP